MEYIIIIIIIILYYLLDLVVMCVCIMIDFFIFVKNLFFLKFVVNILYYIFYIWEMRFFDRSIDVLREFLWCDFVGVKIWIRNINFYKS